MACGSLLSCDHTFANILLFSGLNGLSISEWNAFPPKTFITKFWGWNAFHHLHNFCKFFHWSWHLCKTHQKKLLSSWLVPTLRGTFFFSAFMSLYTTWTPLYIYTNWYNCNFLDEQSHCYAYCIHLFKVNIVVYLSEIGRASCRERVCHCV